MKVQHDGHVAQLRVHVQETKGVSVLVSAKSLSERGAVINFETSPAVIRNLEPQTVVQLERSSAGHLWKNWSGQMPVDSDNNMSVLGQLRLKTIVDWTSRKSKPHVLTFRIDSQHTSLSRSTHESDTSDIVTMR